MRPFLAAVAAVVATLAVPISADANTSSVRFSQVQYDGPGSDTGSNASLNKEWVKVTNFGTTAAKLTGWTIRDPEGHVFKFPEFKLKAGKTVTIHSGTGTATKTDLFWDEDTYVWNNSGDKAILKDTTKAQIDVCKWGDGTGVTAC